jgi:glucosamine-6-phosphate deaminase
VAAFVLRSRDVAGQIELYVTDEPDEVARGAAADVLEVVRRTPGAAILFAVGDSTSPLYAELAEHRRTGALDASAMRAVQLDEYVGVAPADAHSLFRWLEREVTGPLAITPERIVDLRGDAADLDAECERYELAVRDVGGIDLAVLGLGLNGHLGFNEPPSAADAPTRTVKLTEQSLATSAGYWGGRERVPRVAVTAGMRVILAARDIVLVVTGERKSAILHRALDGEISPEVPASFLREHPRVRVYADRAAWEGAGAARMA